jgi:hypothetical protein
MVQEVDEPTTGPPATGLRLPWSALPVALRAEIEARLGSRVVAADTQRGGFSPGVAARLRLADGCGAFIKAVGPAPNPDSPDIHRAEARIAATLPADAPAPRLIFSLDREGWVALLFEDVAGTMPTLPWLPAELDRVMAMVADLAAALTPSPSPRSSPRWRGSSCGCPDYLRRPACPVCAPSRRRRAVPHWPGCVPVPGGREPVTGHPGPIRSVGFIPPAPGSSPAG